MCPQLPGGGERQVPRHANAVPKVLQADRHMFTAGSIHICLRASLPLCSCRGWERRLDPTDHGSISVMAAEMAMRKATKAPPPKHHHPSAAVVWCALR